MADSAAYVNPYQIKPALTPDMSEGDLDLRDYTDPASNDPNGPNGAMDSPFGAYAPVLRSFPGGTPDPMRIQTMPERDFRPHDRQPPEEWWADREADKDAQENAAHVYQNTVGFEETRGPLRRFADNPRSVPPPESRLTNRMSPHTYLFTRDMWGGPMRNNGEHFSMADFRRNYPIMGTQPVRTWRNTYRIMPAPYDTAMVEENQDIVAPVTGAVTVSPETPMSNPWRL